MWKRGMRVTHHMWCDGLPQCMAWPNSMAASAPRSHSSGYAIYVPDVCICHSHVSPPSSTSFKYISTCHLVRHLIRQCRVSAVVLRCSAAQLTTASLIRQQAARTQQH